MTEETSVNESERKPAASWLTRADTVVALVLAVVFIVIVGIMLYRQHMAGSGIEVISGDGETVTYRVDLNEATPQELMLLPGIGEVRSERIVKWRAENGPFTSLDQVGEATGLSSKQLEELKPFIMFKSQE